MSPSSPQTARWIVIPPFLHDAAWRSAVVEAVEDEPVARGVGERVEHGPIVQERRRRLAFILDEDQVGHAHAQRLDARSGEIGGTAKSFAAGDVQRMALEVPMDDYSIEVLPFLAALIGVLLLLTLFPQISLLLPDLVFGR